MLKYLVVIMIIFLSSCCGLHTEVHYTYNDVTIKRIDECGITSFYYGNSKIRDAGRIWVKYAGINDGFDGYIRFYSSGKVILLSGDGYFESENLDTSFFELGEYVSYNRPEIGDSICFITLATRYEKDYNDKGKTGVKVEYFY